MNKNPQVNKFPFVLYTSEILNHMSVVLALLPERSIELMKQNGDD